MKSREACGKHDMISHCVTWQSVTWQNITWEHVMFKLLSLCCLSFALSAWRHVHLTLKLSASVNVSAQQPAHCFVVCPMWWSLLSDDTCASHKRMRRALWWQGKFERDFSWWFKRTWTWCMTHKTERIWMCMLTGKSTSWHRHVQQGPLIVPKRPKRLSLKPSFIKQQ